MTSPRHHFPTPGQRSAEILDAVRGTFAEKGFDGASMQDLARAAGMSVGNFYRYFPSKAAIVDALIERDLESMERDFNAVIAHPDPIGALRVVIAARIAEHQSCTDGQLWAEITASAQRKPDIGASAARMEAAIRGYMIGVFAKASGWPVAQAQACFSPHAAFIMVLFKSAAMAAAMTADVRAPLTRMILSTIDRTLDEIASASPKA